MDLVVLFDSVVLHEMTHSGSIGIPQWDLGVPEEYGWDECVFLESPVNSGMLKSVKGQASKAGEALEILSIRHAPLFPTCLRKEEKRRD